MFETRSELEQLLAVADEGGAGKGLRASLRIEASRTRDRRTLRAHRRADVYRMGDEIGSMCSAPVRPQGSSPGAPAARRGRVRGFGYAQTHETRVATFDGRRRRVGGGLSDHGRAGNAGNGRRPRGGSRPAAGLGQRRGRRHSGSRPVGPGGSLGDVERRLALHGAGGVGPPRRAKPHRTRRRCADRAGNARGGLLRPGGPPLPQSRPGTHSLPSQHRARILQGCSASISRSSPWKRRWRARTRPTSGGGSASSAGGEARARCMRGTSRDHHCTPKALPHAAAALRAGVRT